MTDNCRYILVENPQYPGRAEIKEFGELYARIN